MNTIFLGDIMPSGVYKDEFINISPKIERLLINTDCRIATLESAIGLYEDIDQLKKPAAEVSVWSFESDIEKLKSLGINVVSLANNHANDCGIERLLDLKKKLRSIGIASIGAGENLEEASKPFILEKEGKTLAIIGVCQNNPYSLGTLQFASKNTAGVYEYDEKTLKKQISALKREYNYVVVVIHWGIEHMWLPEINDVCIAEKLVDSGADAIIGGHPHHIQPVLEYKSKPIFYSLGNFYFPDFYLDEKSNTYYPSPYEASRIPTFDWMAPGIRRFSMRYFWKYYGKLGMIAQLSFDTDISYIEHYSIMDGNSLKYAKAITTKISLKIFKLLVGRRISIYINKFITVFTHLFEHKFLGLFIKKYQFFNYIKKRNYDNNFN